MASPYDYVYWSKCGISHDGCTEAPKQQLLTISCQFLFTQRKDQQMVNQNYHYQLPLCKQDILIGK